MLMAARRPIPAAAALAPEALAALFRACCRAEIGALKPGNVGLHGDGHGMVAQQFIDSAEAAAGPIAQAGASLGERILAAVSATRAVVGCNTNLGIVLLAAPLIQAAQAAGPGSLRERTGALIDAAGVEDTRLVYRAIRLAAPGGLGASERHDVAAEPRVTLREAMAEAAPRDLIARQYAGGYAEVFDTGLPLVREGLARHGSLAGAAAHAYLFMLERFPDSHIARKLGAPAALAVSRDAKRFTGRISAGTSLSELAPDLLEWDGALKTAGVNPGTTADMTVAALLALGLSESPARLLDDAAA